MAGQGVKGLVLVALLALAGCRDSSAPVADRPAGPDPRERAADPAERRPAPEPAGPVDPRLQDPYLRHVVRLADEPMGGRPTWGEQSAPAREYVFEQFAAAGFARVPALGAAGGAQVTEHRFEVPIEKLGPGNLLRCTFLEDRASTIHIGRLGRTFLPLNFSANAQAQGAILFVGYGIEAAEVGLDDYREQVVEGKVVFALDGLPLALRQAAHAAGAAKLPEGALPPPDPRGEVAWKAAHAQKRGAAAFVLLVPDPPPARGPDGQPTEPPPGGLALECAAAAWEEHLPVRSQARIDSPEGKATNMTPRFVAVGMQSRQVRPPAPLAIPCAAAPVSLAARILGVPAETLAGAIATGDPATPISLPRSEAFLHVAIERSTESGTNVIAFLPGTSPELQRDVLVVGAHYDHLGREGGTGGHFPGAADNASGVAALLESARALVAAPPRRSVLLAAFAGEEWGLWGSRGFCAKPPIPLERIVAMINLDMVGTDKEKACHVLGTMRNPDLYERVVAANGRAALVLQGGIEFAFKYGSDHWPFHQAGIPAAMLTTSRYPEYHTRKDVAEIVSREMIERVTWLVTDAVTALGNSDVRFAKPMELEVPFPKRGK